MFDEYMPFWQWAFVIGVLTGAFIMLAMTMQTWP